MVGRALRSGWSFLGIWSPPRPTTSCAGRPSVSTLDDSAERIDVPGHWRNHPKFAAERRSAALSPSIHGDAPDAGRRRWVTLDGIFYQADVWLDGAYLGDPEGYFIPHTFDITAWAGFATSTCWPSRWRARHRAVPATAQHHRRAPTVRRDRPQLEPGRHVAAGHVYDTGPVRIDRLACCAAMPTRHERTCDSTPGSTATIAGGRGCGTPDGRPIEETERTIAGGHNDVSGTSTSTTRRCGGHVRSANNHSPRCRRGGRRRRGQRSPAGGAPGCGRWRGTTGCSVNGERLFLKGANLLPTRAGARRCDTRHVASRHRVGGRCRSRCCASTATSHRGRSRRGR